MLGLLRLPRAEVSLVFVNDRRMRLLNRRYRGIDRTTDVLSFPQYRSRELHARIGERTRFKYSQTPRSPLLLGDIVINLHRARLQAIDAGSTMDEELKRLLIHGLLHLLGYDHERGKHAEQKMERTSRMLFKKISAE